MDRPQEHYLTGIARPKNADEMLTEICEHFVEHADVERDGSAARLVNKFGTTNIRSDRGRLLIDLRCPSPQALQLSRTNLAEHLFYFAGDEAFELSWDDAAPKTSLPNLHFGRVVRASDITPRMRRVTFSCADVSPFIKGDMHVRLLVPPRGRKPVWPGIRSDGRIAWPEGADELLVRVYTIRAVDEETNEISIDFLQHSSSVVSCPGADFARDAEPGQEIALMGPGAGSMPDATSILLAGDESALPAIARIAAEALPGTSLEAIIEVSDEAEEQIISSMASITVRWLHRDRYPVGAKGVLLDQVQSAINTMDEGTFVWFAGEKEDVRSLRSFLKGRNHAKKNMYVAWYWEHV
ncbi:DUF2218 domain-containing protein [Oryzifoliimicrobium ureilyticus]|uniref:DUF2218 domain-containing protein n=1 Tax=Oryzifoliimicrobium ureilyticus TaxID=3113724 RepID=UPI0030768509